MMTWASPKNSRNKLLLQKQSLEQNFSSFSYANIQNLLWFFSITSNLPLRLLLPIKVVWSDANFTFCYFHTIVFWKLLTLALKSSTRYRLQSFMQMETADGVLHSICLLCLIIEPNDIFHVDNFYYCRGL